MHISCLVTEVITPPLTDRRDSIFSIMRQQSLFNMHKLFISFMDQVQSRASSIDSNPLYGNSGRYLSVLKIASEYGLSLLTCGLE